MRSGCPTTSGSASRPSTTTTGRPPTGSSPSATPPTCATAASSPTRTTATRSTCRRRRATGRPARTSGRPRSTASSRPPGSPGGALRISVPGLHRSVDTRSVSRTLASPVLVGRERQLGRLIEALRAPGRDWRAQSWCPVRRDRARRGCCTSSWRSPATAGQRRCLGPASRSAPETSPSSLSAVLCGSCCWSRPAAELDDLLEPPAAICTCCSPSSHRRTTGTTQSREPARLRGSVLGRRRVDTPVAVVLAVDDAQWADQSTLQLLRYLVQSGQPQPLLVVVAYRGEDLPADPGRRKAFEELSRAADDVVTVDPLDDAQVAELVRGIGAELSTSSMARLRERSSGLPFLIEELVAAERDGVTRGIPRRVRDVVRLRLGALSEDAQLVVALVAVAARPLRHRVLSDAAHLPARRFAAALDEALTANLLVADTTAAHIWLSPRRRTRDRARGPAHRQPAGAAPAARHRAPGRPSGRRLRDQALRGGIPLAADRGERGARPARRAARRPGVDTCLCPSRGGQAVRPTSSDCGSGSLYAEVIAGADLVSCLRRGRRGRALVW